MMHMYDTFEYILNILSKYIFIVHNVSQWPNLRQMAESEAYLHMHQYYNMNEVHLNSVHHAVCVCVC